VVDRATQLDRVDVESGQGHQHVFLPDGPRRSGAPPRCTASGQRPSAPRASLPLPLPLAALEAVVTGCAIAIAETGTIVLDGSIDQGRRELTLVPDHHVCVVPEDRIVGSVPEGLARIDPVRPVTLISGPSATSDIELDRVEGVHGPRRLDVIIVAPARSA
jgi:L-lactate dehydrogenase complex protein LldG